MTPNRSRALRTACVALMDPVLTDDPAFLMHYGHALRVMADVADKCGHPRVAARYRARAYYLRTLAK